MFASASTLETLVISGKQNLLFPLGPVIKCFFQFEWHVCELACGAKCMTTINKHLTMDIFFLPLYQCKLIMCSDERGSIAQ